MRKYTYSDTSVRFNVTNDRHQHVFEFQNTQATAFFPAWAWSADDLGSLIPLNFLYWYKLNKIFNSIYRLILMGSFRYAAFYMQHAKVVFRLYFSKVPNYFYFLGGSHGIVPRYSEWEQISYCKYQRRVIIV